MQISLLLKVLPYIAPETKLALNGGTALNLFLRDMPRISVDIDLTYLPFDNRETALNNISGSLGVIKTKILQSAPEIMIGRYITEGNEIKLFVQSKKAQIKIEVNTITRGHLFPPRILRLNGTVQEEYKSFAAVQVVSDAELYGGKICAALDRQHPRDLFDVYLLFKETGITEDIKNGFIAALVSHMRPMNEILRPHPLDQKSAFNRQFSGMSAIPFTYDDFENTREHLVKSILSVLSDRDRLFLMSFKRGKPDWELFPVPVIKEMPAVLWKLNNILSLKKINPQKHIELTKKLEGIIA